MIKHKHYYAIRAYADGWKIEKFWGGAWELLDFPSFITDGMYRVVPDENGWLPWYGGECQAEPDTMVEIWFYNCIARGRGKVSEYDWDSNQIIAYRILKEADPYAELKAAAKDPTKQIRRIGHKWCDSGEWFFSDGPENYEIRNKPKKIKFLAWFHPSDGALFWRPEEVKEVEVED